MLKKVRNIFFDFCQIYCFGYFECWPTHIYKQEVPLMSGKGCKTCCPEGSEERIMLAFLRKALLRLNLDYQPDFSQINDSQLFNDLAFPRLLDLLFHTNHSDPKSAHFCPHSRFSRYLRRKLRCNMQTFNGLCNQLINTLAKRNYQLSVLQAQIKSALVTSQSIAVSPLYSSLVNQILAKVRQEHVQQCTKPFLASQTNIKGYDIAQIDLKAQQATDIRIVQMKSSLSLEKIQPLN